MTIVYSHVIIPNCADIFCEFCHAYQEEFPVITELASQEKVIGVKQSRKAIRDGRAKRVYVVVWVQGRGMRKDYSPLAPSVTVSTGNLH